MKHNKPDHGEHQISTLVGNWLDPTEKKGNGAVSTVMGVGGAQSLGGLIMHFGQSKSEMR